MPNIRFRAFKDMSRACHAMHVPNTCVRHVSSVACFQCCVCALFILLFFRGCYCVLNVLCLIHCFGVRYFLNKSFFVFDFVFCFLMFVWVWRKTCLRPLSVYLVCLRYLLDLSWTLGALG